MITGIRGLCNGLGPAVFGIIFYLFHVDLNQQVDVDGTLHTKSGANVTIEIPPKRIQDHVNTFQIHLCIKYEDFAFPGTKENMFLQGFWLQIMPGPPFVFGSLMVVLAVAVALLIPERKSVRVRRQGGSDGTDQIDLENPQRSLGHTPSQTMVPLISSDPAIL
jgi:hypothetical protein